MGILDFLGLNRIEITPQETITRLFSSDEAGLHAVINEIKNGYTEEHGRYCFNIYSGASNDEKEKIIHYLQACNKWHSLRTLQDGLALFEIEENSVIRGQLVDIYPVVNQEFIDILVKKLGRSETSDILRESIGEIIAKSGVVQRLTDEYDGASKRRKLKILHLLAELQNPESYELIFDILKEEKTESKSEEKRPFQKELMKLLEKFQSRPFMSYFCPRVHELDTSVLHEVFSCLRIYKSDFYEMLLKNLRNQNTTFQHKCLTIMGRMLDESAYLSLFNTFFGHPNSAIEEETEDIISKLLKRYTDHFEKARKGDEAVIKERDEILQPLETRLWDPGEERTLFMCEHIIRFGLIWPEVLMRNFPALASKHLTYVRKLFQSLPTATRVNLFTKGMLFSEGPTGQAVLDLISSTTMSYHEEVMPTLMKEHFMEMIPDIRQKLVSKMLEDNSVLAPYLEVLLQSVDTEKKLEVLDILSQFDNDAAWSFIKKRLTDPSQKVRKKILEMLEKSQFDNTQVVVQLISFFKDTDSEIIIMAINILSEKEHSAVLASLSKILNHNIPEVKQAAREAMLKVTKRKYFSSFQKLSKELRYQVGASIITMDSSFLEDVSRDIGHAEDSKRRLLCAQILEALAEHLTSDIQVHLIVAINDPDPNVRAAVIMGLGRVGGPAITNMLLGYLNDQDDRVRANTVEAFGFIGDKDMINEIIPALKDPNNRVKGNAIITLWKLEYFEVFETIGVMLQNEDKWMRASAVFAMGELKDMRFANFLLMALKDSEEDVRRNAVKALYKLSETQFMGIFQQMRFDQSEAVRDEIQFILDKFKNQN